VIDDPELPPVGVIPLDASRARWRVWAPKAKESVAIRLLGGGGEHPLDGGDEVARAGHSHYNQELRGGEGHMEVAKLILNVVKQKSHMTLSVKPFGCMPSSGVSDGVQSVITELWERPKRKEER